MKNNILVNNYLDQFKSIYSGPTWYGESYMEKLKTIDEGMAFKKPGNDIHSIAELISHAIYWRKALIDVLEGRKYAHKIKNKGNWVPNEQLKAVGWEKLKTELAENQQKISDLLQPLSDIDLSRDFRDGKPLNYLVSGVIHHDVYHLGQIGLVKNLL